MAAKGTTKLNLSVEIIENHKFGNSPRGYDALEVDKFLDLIIQDYLLIEEATLIDVKELKLAEKKIEELRKENEKLMLENKKLEAKVPTMTNANVNKDNIKLLERINVYEKYLYKNGVDPKKLK